MSFGVAADVTALAFLPFAAGADLREDFRAPKGAVRENTGPLFWLHGTETPERLREYVGRVDESVQGILTIESRPHINWMRPEWWRDVDIVLQECKRRGLGRGASPRRPLHFGPLGERVLPFSGAFCGCCTIRWMSPLEKCFCIVKSCFVTL